MEPYAEIADQYAEFAVHAAGSPCFREWSLGVAGDPETQQLIATLPGIKRQPNLVFAAARWHGVPAPCDYRTFRDALHRDFAAISETIAERSTQTNEVGRLATLLPVFGRCDEPLALVEVGASAGLVLYPDRYRYAYTDEHGGQREVGSELGPQAPVLRCRTEGPVSLPEELPQVSWRAGVDLHPLDVHREDQTAWLETLVWPEQDERRARLRTAIEVAKTDPPHLVTGDLLDAVPELVEHASHHGRPVVFASAVIAYLTPRDRVRYADMMTDLVAAGKCRWISNEAPRVLDQVTRSHPVTAALLEEPTAEEDLGFVLGLDGRAVARTHGHGDRIAWLS